MLLFIFLTFGVIYPFFISSIIITFEQARTKSNELSKQENFCCSEPSYNFLAIEL